jgi:glycosyltransferase involved in cell wall biosynthesis
MRVLFLTKYYPPSEGGIERYGHMLCSDLAAHGIEVEVVAASEENEATREEWIDGVKVYRLRSQMRLSSTPISFGLPFLLKDMVRDFDIIHINFPNPWTDLLYLIIGRSCKAVMTYHSDIFRQKGTLSGLLLQSYHPFIHKVLSGVSAVIASSPNCIKNSPFLSRQASKCRVIPMPVDAASLAEVEVEAIQKERDQFGKFVLFVGRFVYYKGVRHLIEALSHSKAVRLVVVGRGPLEGEYRRLVDELGLRDRVFFVGKIADDRLRALYHACHCLALPSVSHAEGFGMVLAEAMACGKPVISTQLKTGTSYVNLDGVTGYVVPPGDPKALAEKIDILMLDEEIHKRMGLQAKHRAETEFDRPIVTERTIRLYEDVLAEREIDG